MAFSNLLSRGLGGSPKLKNTGEPPVPRSLLSAIVAKPRPDVGVVNYSFSIQQRTQLPDCGPVVTLENAVEFTTEARRRKEFAMGICG